MDQQRADGYGDYPNSYSTSSSWSYDGPVPHPPYHDGGNFNHGGPFSDDGHYNHHHQFQQHHQNFGAEPNDSPGFANEFSFSGRKRQFSNSANGTPGSFRSHQSKVFVNYLNKKASKVEIAEIFSPYGCIQEVFLLRDEQKQNRGMGFIAFSHRDMAAAAINALNGKYVMKGCDQPLIVRFATPKKPKTGEIRPAPYISDQTPHNASHGSSQAGSEPPSVSSTSAVPTCDEATNPPDCDWSEHICPDGYTYYYNCVTCESRWEEPEEFSFHDQQPIPPWQHTHSIQDVPQIQQLQPQT